MVKKSPLPTIEAEAILETIADGLFTVDRDFRIQRFNRRAVEITGFEPDEAIGEYCWNILRTDVCESACVLKEALKAGGRVSSVQVSILSAEDEEVPIDVSATAIMNDGLFAGGVETFRDLSGLTLIRQELLDHALAQVESGAILASALPEMLREQKSTGSIFTSTKEDERLAILDALRATDGNKNKAADLLKISRATLWRKMKALDIPLR